jgi:hypothetical protein
MQEFDVDAFITELERLGLKLTATRLLDGTCRVNRWGMPDARTHSRLKICGQNTSPMIKRG